MEHASAPTVLIVDDEERNRKLLDVFVKAEGYKTIAAAGGKAGMAMAASELPDLILLDLMMPDVDGFDVVRWLKGNPATRAIPVIIVSSLDDVAAHKRILVSGADEFINKPVDRWELSLRMSKLLQEAPGPALPPAPPTAGGETSNG